MMEGGRNETGLGLSSGLMFTPTTPFAVSGSCLFQRSLFDSLFPTVKPEREREKAKRMDLEMRWTASPKADVVATGIGGFEW